MVITEYICWHKNLLGNEQLRVSSINLCEKRLPVKKRIFRERSYFPQIWFKDHWKHKAYCDKHFVWNFDDHLSSNFHRFVILCIMLRYTMWEYWSLTITKRVSSVFKKMWCDQANNESLKYRPTQFKLRKKKMYS